MSDPNGLTDPQPGDPGTSFAGFVLYREMAGDHRSVREVARRLGRSQSLIDRYSSRWNWVERASTWDLGQARATSRVRAKLEGDWKERHSEEGRKLQIFAMAALGNHILRDGEGRIVGVNGIPLRDALLMMRIGSQIERTAQGAEPSGTISSEFVVTVAEAFATAFQEVNRLEHEEERANAFQKSCLAIVSKLLTEDDGEDC